MNLIGIDLGTTNSVVAVAGKERRVLKKAGCDTALTPSVVACEIKKEGSPGRIIVGRDAVANAGRDPANTIFSIKRLMGRMYGEKWQVYEGWMDVDEVGRHVSYTIAPPPEPARTVRRRASRCCSAANPSRRWRFLP